MITKASQAAAFTLVILIGITGSLIVHVSEASFVPPPQEVSMFYIRSDGALEPIPVPISTRSNVDHYSLDSQVVLNPASEPFSIAMPQESVNYTITVRNGKLWAVVDGFYPMHLTGSLPGLPMVYPIPPDTTNMHVWLDGLELEWGNYSNVDPSIHHHTDIGDWNMIYCTINPAASDFLLEIHYEHPVEVINATYTFLYDLNISPYLSSEEPNSPCHFPVKLPSNVSGLKAYTTGFDSGWTQTSYNHSSTDSSETAVFDIVSGYDALVGDVAFVLEGVDVPEFWPWPSFTFFFGLLRDFRDCALETRQKKHALDAFEMTSVIYG